MGETLNKSKKNKYLLLILLLVLLFLLILPLIFFLNLTIRIDGKINDYFYNIEYKLNDNKKKIIHKDMYSHEEKNTFSSGEITLISNEKIEVFENEYYWIYVKLNFGKGSIYVNEAFGYNLYESIVSTSFKLNDVQVDLIFLDNNNIDRLFIYSEFIYYGLNIYEIFNNKSTYNGTIAIYGLDEPTISFALKNDLEIWRYSSTKICRYFGINYEKGISKETVEKENYWDIYYSDAEEI